MRIISLFICLSFLLFSVQSCKDACDDVDCGPNGTCIDGSCSCDAGYSGVNCDIFDNCQGVDCGLNGTCVNGTCDCDEGYSGANCEINVCDTVDCINGICDRVTGACDCNEGYEGDNCGTEIRAKYYGIFVGDLLPCIPIAITGLVPADTLAPLAMTQLQVLESSAGINFVSIGSTSTVLELNVDADINEETFDIPTFEQSIMVAGFSVTVSGMGTGKLIDDTSMELSLDLVFSTPGISLNNSCTTIFTKT